MVDTRQFVTGPAVKRTVDVSSAVLGAGSVATVVAGNAALPTDMVNQRFAGLTIIGAGPNGTAVIQTQGYVDPTFLNLGNGTAATVGVNASGRPVRTGDPSCVSGSNLLGWCDSTGGLFIDPSVALSAKNTAVVDFVVDCGADPTGVTDCAAAWDIAFAKVSALATNPALVKTSAVLFIPPGAYTLRSNPVTSTWNFQNLATTLYIKGAGQDTTLFQFSGFDLPQFANMFSLFVSDITFAGTTPNYQTPDMTNGIGANVSNSIVFERVKFYNLAATQSILTVTASQTIVLRDCQLTACGATTNAKAMIVIDSPQICLIENFVTLDIGLVNGFAAVGKDNAGYKEFLVIGGATDLDGLVTFSHCFWDESTTASVTIQGNATYPMPRVHFDQCYWNPSTASGPMIDASHVQLLEVSGGIDSNFHAADTALVVNAVACDVVRVRKMQIVTSEPGVSHTVAADSACKLVEIEECPAVAVNAASANTRVVYRTNGVESNQFSTGAAVTANQLVKMTTTGIQTLGTADASSLLFGVTQDSAGGASANVRVARRGQRVTVLSDGATTIAVGDQITNSAATAGDVKKGASNVIGIALTAATNVAGTPFDMQFL